MLVKCCVSEFSVRATFRIAILLHGGAMNVQLCEASTMLVMHLPHASIPASPPAVPPE